MPGEHFVIGTTTFTLTDQQVCVSADAPPPAQQQSFSVQALKQIRFRNPDYRIEVLSRVPEVLSGAKDQNDLCVALVAMLLAGVPGAEMVAVVALEEDAAGPQPAVRVLHWDQRLALGGDFQPSERLIRQAIGQDESVLYVWGERESDSLSPFTARGDVRLGLLHAGAGQGPAGLGALLGRAVRGERAFGTRQPRSERSARGREVRRAGGRGRRGGEPVAGPGAAAGQPQPFFSPVVLKTLWFQDPEVVLAPREALISVLFCDLRGFSLETERHAGNLLELLHRVSRALGVMTHQILDQGGVVGDFQGDAAMGFWGWPLAQEDAVARACRAALAIRAEFEEAARDPQSPLAGFHVGIGIATGNAVAGKIGTVDQVKVTVFGPAVNLASRLEGMTRLLGARILLDEATAQAIGRQVSKRGCPRSPVGAGAALRHGSGAGGERAGCRRSRSIRS